MPTRIISARPDPDPVEQQGEVEQSQIEASRTRGGRRRRAARARVAARHTRRPRRLGSPPTACEVCSSPTSGTPPSSTSCTHIANMTANTPSPSAVIAETLKTTPHRARAPNDAEPVPQLLPHPMPAPHRSRGSISTGRARLRPEAADRSQAQRRDEKRHAVCEHDAGQPSATRRARPRALGRRGARGCCSTRSASWPRRARPHARGAAGRRSPPGP